MKRLVEAEQPQVASPQRDQKISGFSGPGKYPHKSDFYLKACCLDFFYFGSYSFEMDPAWTKLGIGACTRRDFAWVQRQVWLRIRNPLRALFILTAERWASWFAVVTWRIVNGVHRWINLPPDSVISMSRPSGSGHSRVIRWGKTTGWVHGLVACLLFMILFHGSV